VWINRKPATGAYAGGRLSAPGSRVEELKFRISSAEAPFSSLILFPGISSS